MTVEAIGEVPQWTLGDRMGKALRESDIGVQGMADYLGRCGRVASGAALGHHPNG